MHPKLPCINPFCTQTFSPDELEGVAKLECPKCGAVFELASVPLPAPVDVPIAQPVAAPERPVEEPPHFAFPPTAEIVPSSPRRWAGRSGKSRFMGWIAGVSVGAVVLALAIGSGLWLRNFLKVQPSNQQPALGEGYNARFVPPDKPWLRDKEIQQRFHVHIGMKSPERNLGLGILFKDYRNRLPSEREMVDEAVGKLRSYFQGVETEIVTRDEQVRLADHPAQVCKFQGEGPDHVMMNGECLMMAFRGYGYWFFTWAPLSEVENDADAIHAEWDRLRQRLSLLDDRRDWKEKSREMQRIVGKKAKYTLSFAKGAWTPQAVEDEDPRVDLILKGQEPDPEQRPSAARSATVLVFVLPRQRDLKSASSAALDYVKQRERKLYERTTWEPIKDKDGPFDRDSRIGAEKGHLSKLQVRNTEDLERYLSIAVVNRPEGVVVLVGDCLWERRDFWDQEFTALFQAFTAR